MSPISGLPWAVAVQIVLLLDVLPVRVLEQALELGTDAACGGKDDGHE